MTATLDHPRPIPGWQDGDEHVDTLTRAGRRWGPRLPPRHPRQPRRGGLALAGWDRGAYRRTLAAELRAAIREMHAVDVRWVRDGGAQLGHRWHRALQALDRLAGHALHEIAAAADADPDGLDTQAIIALAHRPGTDPNVRALGDLLAADALLARHREIELQPITRRLERAAGLEPTAA